MLINLKEINGIKIFFGFIAGIESCVWGSNPCTQKRVYQRSSALTIRPWVNLFIAAATHVLKAEAHGSGGIPAQDSQ